MKKYLSDLLPYKVINANIEGDKYEKNMSTMILEVSVTTHMDRLPATK